jgi:hypothetical protein
LREPSIFVPVNETNNKKKFPNKTSITTRLFSLFNAQILCGGMTRLNKIQKGCEEGTGCKGLEGIKKANSK